MIAISIAMILHWIHVGHTMSIIDQIESSNTMIMITGVAAMKDAAEAAAEAEVEVLVIAVVTVVVVAAVEVENEKGMK